MIPLVLGVVLWMAFPYIDRNPETHPSKRKFAIMFYTFFLAGAGVLTIIGVLFRGPGWNWTYPWIDEFGLMTCLTGYISNDFS